ncbi:MAG: hypothetical protein RRZ70_02660 [Synergistaceae bacterium]
MNVSSMTIDVLVATLYPEVEELIAKMKIQSNAIVCSQCASFVKREIDFHGYKVANLCFDETGVGLNRNNALMRSKADVCLLADDDVVYRDGYPEIIKKSFNDNPTADILIFNLANKTSGYNYSKKKVNFLNFMRYGAVQIAFKRKPVSYAGIFFNTNFGGGTQHCSGEDTLFLADCLKAGLKVIALPIEIGTLTETRPSTWFEGFNKKYFFDKGVFFATLSPKLSKILCLQLLIRHKEMLSNGVSLLIAYKEMLRGIKYVLENKNDK